jgi:hypothetical protein
MLVLGVAMLVHWWVLGQLLLGSDSAPIFMAESAVVQRMVAGILSLFIAGLLVLLAVVIAALLVMSLDFWNMSEPPDRYSPAVRQRRWLVGLQRAFAIILGFSMGTIIVDRGKLYQPDWQEVDIRSCTGPLFVDVREGQVVVIEDRGLTNAARHGRIWLNAHQRVTGHADLTVQKAPVVVEHALTKDGLIIDRFELTVRFSIGKGKNPVAGWPTSGQFPYNDVVTRDKMWKDTPETYKAGVVAVAQIVARSIIGSCDLKDLVKLPDVDRSAVETAIRNGIQSTMQDETGVWLDVKSVAIGEVAVPAPAEKELTDHWVALMQADTGEIRSQTDKKTLLVKSEGQAEAFANLEKAKDIVRAGLITQIKSLSVSDPQLADRYLSALEKLTGHLVQDSVQGWHTVEMLEGIAHGSESVNLFIAPNGALQQAGGLPILSGDGAAAGVPISTARSQRLHTAGRKRRKHTDSEQ